MCTETQSVYAEEVSVHTVQNTARKYVPMYTVVHFLYSQSNLDSMPSMHAIDFHHRSWTCRYVNSEDVLSPHVTINSAPHQFDEVDPCGVLQVIPVTVVNPLQTGRCKGHMLVT